MNACLKCEAVVEVAFSNYFCSQNCEDTWARDCLNKLSGEECLELMAAVMSAVGSYSANQVRAEHEAFAAMAGK